MIILMFRKFVQKESKSIFNLNLIIKSDILAKKKTIVERLYGKMRDVALLNSGVSLKFQETSYSQMSFGNSLLWPSKVKKTLKIPNHLKKCQTSDCCEICFVLWLSVSVNSCSKLVLARWHGGLESSADILLRRLGVYACHLNKNQYLGKHLD